MPLAQLTGQGLTTHYRLLEKSGRKDHRARRGPVRADRPLHPHDRSRHLGQAVKDELLLRNPADAATPPTAKEAKAPEMHPWDAGQLAAFLGWAEEQLAVLPLVAHAGMTGMRRGEALALRWRDVDLDAATVSVRRSAGMVRVAGEEAVCTRATPSPANRAWSTWTTTPRRCSARGGKPAGEWRCSWSRRIRLVFGDIEGGHRNPEHVSRQFLRDLERCAKALGAAAPPRSGCTTCGTRTQRSLLTAREPVHVVSQRLGHASAVVTLSVYAHVMPGNQRETANTFARLVREARGA